MVYSALTTRYARSGPINRVVRGSMALTQRLEIRQSHALVMTPQLMQAIKLLQLSNLDLATYVDGDYDLEAFVSAERTLADHLAEQLVLAIADPVRRMIGQYLIDLVDEAGYLTGDLATAADKLGAAPAEVAAVLTVLQGFDPPGVCARNLTECLAIQLKDRDRFDPAMQALVAHLDLLAKRDLAALRKVCGVDEEDLNDMIGEIRQLNPKPGLAFGTTLVQPMVPDVFVRGGPDGGFIIELNSDTLPKVLVNQSYYTQIAGSTKGSTDKAYLADCLQTATWLIRA